jgi:hypothetical protein
MSCKSSINQITNPNPVYSHTKSRDDTMSTKIATLVILLNTQGPSPVRLSFWRHDVAPEMFHTQYMPEFSALRVLCQWRRNSLCSRERVGCGRIQRGYAAKVWTSAKPATILANTGVSTWAIYLLPRCHHVHVLICTYILHFNTLYWISLPKK